jgi:hypothetical protein
LDAAKLRTQPFTPALPASLAAPFAQAMADSSSGLSVRTTQPFP